MFNYLWITAPYLLVGIKYNKTNHHHHNNNNIMHWMLWLLAPFIIVWVMSKFSSSVNYHLKYAGYLLYCIFLAGCSGVFCLFYKPGSSQNIFIPQFLIKLIQFEWLFGLKLKYQDLHFLHNVAKPCVVVSNHQTAFDALLLLIASPPGTAPLAKKILQYVPIFGPVCWLCGTIFIDRSKGATAIQIMKKIGEEMKEKMTSLWIFPEGSRYQCDRIMEFKKGAFHLAVQAQVPIVPVVFGNYRNVIDGKNKRYNGGEIRTIVLPPISTEGKTPDDVNDLVASTQKLISDTFQKDFVNHPEVYKDLIPLKEN